MHHTHTHTLAYKTFFLLLCTIQKTRKQVIVSQDKWILNILVIEKIFKKIHTQSIGTPCFFFHQIHSITFHINFIFFFYIKKDRIGKYFKSDCIFAYKSWTRKAAKFIRKKKPSRKFQ